MKRALIAMLTLCATSCIPLQYAPEIADFEVVVAKKFKNNLPKRYAFVFEDLKDANQFNQFVRWKLGRIDLAMDENIPFNVDDGIFYMTFYERSKKTHSINLLPLLFNGEAEGDELYNNEGKSWYILITVADYDDKDCLNPYYPYQGQILRTLKDLKDEYEGW